MAFARRPRFLEAAVWDQVHPTTVAFGAPFTAAFVVAALWSAGPTDGWTWCVGGLLALVVVGSALRLLQLRRRVPVIELTYGIGGAMLFGLALWLIGPTDEGLRVGLLMLRWQRVTHLPTWLVLTSPRHSCC